MKKTLLLFLIIGGTAFASRMDAQNLSRRLTLFETIYTAH